MFSSDAGRVAPSTRRTCCPVRVRPLSLEGVSQMVYILPERLPQHLTSSCEGFEV